MTEGRIKDLFQLVKIRIVGLSALSGGAGYVLAAHRVDAVLGAVTLGLLFLAAASAALNQIQDRRLDAAMERTRHRPLPAGRISVKKAAIVVLGLSTLGAGLLGLAGGSVPLGLGLLAMLWYNGIYTPLKRRTPFACVPGAIIGALPPAVGWTAGGGPLADPRLVGLAFVFFVWQVPHFWLLMMAREDEYAKAGLPTLQSRISPAGAVTVVTAWMLAAGTSALLLVVVGIASTLPLALAAAGLSGWTVHGGLTLWKHPTQAVLRHSFRKVNLYAIAVIGLTVISGFLPSR